MRKFGLIGYPLGHSFSQKYFTEKFALEKITDCSYENFPLKQLEHFPDLIRDNPDLCGLNVTIPYKTGILNYIDVPETAIEEIGAVNVLKIKRVTGEIKIFGFNSDVTGIRDSILPHLNGNIKNVLILGTGGSSRAVSCTMKMLGLNVQLVSRRKRPGILCYIDLTPELIKNTDIIVNTTPLGMYPDISTRPEINYDLLDERHILFDLVYNPEHTSFLKMGKVRGCRIITGLKMLYSQADRSWEIWNDPNL
jgi:shikimate dehydrogenase